MEHGGVGEERGTRIDFDRQGAILDCDRIERVLSLIAIARHNDRNGLAHIADAIAGERPIIDGRLHTDNEWLGHRFDFRAGEHGRDTGACKRLARVDREDLSMRMR